MGKTEFISFKVDSDLRNQIDEEAKQQQRSRSDTIRLLLAQALTSKSAIQAGKTQIDPSFFQGGRA